MQAEAQRPLTAEEEQIALRTVLNARRYVQAEEHVRRLAALTIAMEQFIEELAQSGDELFEALADVIDTAGTEARKLVAAYKG